MDRDIRLALLGDHGAAKRLTDAGVAIPCPFCGEKIIDKEIYSDGCVYSCGRCGTVGDFCGEFSRALLAWNTRAPILSKREMEMLDGKD